MGLLSQGLWPAQLMPPSSGTMDTRTGTEPTARLERPGYAQVGLGWAVVSCSTLVVMLPTLTHPCSVCYRMERDAQFAQRKAERATLRSHFRDKYRLPKVSGHSCQGYPRP